LKILSNSFLLDGTHQKATVDISFPTATASATTATETLATVVTPPTGPNYLYCQICDLSFTSIIHVTQHYEGKNHAKKLRKNPPLQPVPAPSSASASDPASVSASTSGSSPFFCDICCVNATSQPQLDTHLQGKVHRSKVERSKTFPASKQIEKESFVKKDNFSIYRTPSGQFYCSTCNVCVNTESQFGQHLESRKHKQKNASHKTSKK
jgi:matrin type zinc finger protein 3